jgi:hypothetical protein
MAVTVTHETTATAPNDPAKEVSSDAWNAGHTVAGLGDAAELDVGTGAGTVAAGDHNHDAAYEAKNANIQAHVAAAHAPSDAQKNSDITKAEIEAVLTGEIESHTHPAGAGGATMDEVIDNLYPVGALYISTLSTNPGTLIGRGTWSAFGAGRVLVGRDSGDADFDTAEETGGAKTKAISAHAGTAVSAHAGTAVADHASHTHSYTEIVQHTHAVNITDNGHSHVITSQTATTGGATSYEHGTLDTSSAEAEATETTASATTGITATTSNPAGSVASGTTAGPSATLTHSVTQPSNHTVTQPNNHTDLNVVQPYIVVYMWKRTA